MTLQALIDQLQTLAHEGHAQKKVRVIYDSGHIPVKAVTVYQDEVRIYANDRGIV